ncbi:carbon-nitrogen hydrolase family protein [Yinghuangia seranimata]|uniref:carbon-nitrogen hydrolase family protein n=1 Tax=Yinghuangia seranimata TaxID=408067 RepID=UPI00248AA0BF|nr:carbon-nitrogen hydrolase family protein [Yinghuangia seranimata]MDI2128644.1 carbon-nitrogen hydrolase family protein [Yinghuangia seranimata]
MTLDRAPLRVAAAQAHALPGNVADNVATAAQLVRFAASSGADVVVLPELFLSGYDLDLIRGEPDRCEIVPGDRRLDDLAAACYASRTVAVVGGCVRRGGRRTSSLIVVGLDGEAQIGYDAQHLPPDALDLFTPGDFGCSVEIRGWRLGLGTRHDIGFPEHVRAATMDGCDGYLCAGLFTRGDAEYRRGLYLATRALENTCYTVLANHIGATGDGPGCGRSAVFGPDGRVVAEADGERVDVVVATMQDFEIDAARESLTMLTELPCPVTRRERVKLD